MTFNSSASFLNRGKSAVVAGILGASLVLTPVAYAQDATPPVGTPVASPEASPEATAPGEATITNLITADVAELPEAPFTVRLLRITIQPGGITPMHTHHGPEIDVIESGELMIRSLGEAPVVRADGTEEVSSGEDVTLEAGDSVHFPAEVGMYFENTSDEPAVMLSSVIIPVGPDYVQERITWVDGEPTLEGVSYQVLGDGLVQDQPQQAATWTIDTVDLPSGTEMPAVDGIGLITPLQGNFSFTIDAGQVQITRSENEMLQPNAVLGTSASLATADGAFFPNGVTATARENETDPVSLMVMNISPADGVVAAPAELTWTEGDGTLAGTPAEPEGPRLVTTNIDSVNVRTEPSVDADVVTQLAAGIELEVLDGPVEADEYVWYQVRETTEGGEEGWVASEFLDGLDATEGASTETDTEEEADTEETASTPAAEGEFPVDSTVVTTEEGVRIRPETNTDVEALDALPLGTELTVTGAPVDDGEYVWIPVERADGLSGYVVDEFIEAAPSGE